MASDNRGKEASNSVGGNCQTRLPGLKAEPGHVNRQERQYKGAKLVQESPKKQNPRGARQGAQAFPEAGLCLVHGSSGAHPQGRWTTKKPTSFSAGGFQKSGYLQLRIFYARASAHQIFSSGVAALERNSRFI